MYFLPGYDCHDPTRDEKGWLFSNTLRGAKASAIAYRIIETAKENGLNPQAYVQFLLEELPNRDLKDPAYLRHENSQESPWECVDAPGMDVPGRLIESDGPNPLLIARIGSLPAGRTVY